MITINTNVSAMTAQRYLGSSSARSASSLSKLSSGSRVPNAKDDAAALSIGSGLRLDVSALRSAQINAQQANSMLQIADGAYGQISDILVRMKSLTTTSQSDQSSDTERGFLDQEYTALRNEVDRIAGTTDFNGINLLGGSATTGLNSAGTGIDNTAGFVGYTFDDSVVGAGETFEVSFNNANNVLSVLNTGTNEYQSLDVGAVASGETDSYNFDQLGVEITLSDAFDTTTDINAGFGGAATAQFDTAAVGGGVAAANLDFQVGIANGDIINISIDTGNFSDLIGGTVPTDISTKVNAQTATAEIDTAMGAVNAARAEIGSLQNRLDFASSNLATSIENTEAARSTLMDVDVAAEITRFTSEQVLIQSGVSMLAQANQQPSLLLRLLQ